MSTYQRIIPCIFIKQGNAVKGFDDTEVICEDVVELAKAYSESGAYELCVFDLSDSDVEHDLSIDIIKKINRVIHIPMIAGGNVKRLEDVKKMLYAGAKKVVVDFVNSEDTLLLEEVSKRFGKEKILVSVENEKVFSQYKTEIEMYASEVLFCQCEDQNAVVDMTNLETIVLTQNKDLTRISTREDLLESKMAFSDFKLNGEGLIPVIVQDYKTSDVLMLAYMDRDAYEFTLKTGKMTYYSRSRKERWIKGETSGHYQYVKSLTLDCDNDTILAKVDQVGVACHTGAKSCFFQQLVEADSDVLNPLQVFESVYATILDRKINPKEGSYTNYLFDKGIDKILKKVGEEATELVIAAKNPNPEEIKYELSDFLYHAMVLMVEKGVSWDDIVKELADR
ncbi:MAG: bifunctional phosphoribosyl-AMP cyclohydrolase/phosphoribosyl-ATP diphosphatase HisIE [Tyzzerella sp.]|nr:bifunctional phosphoribosyl-AMP cyclohydrolase/phosphoribosyl-ATP diphosphatase HisIE [Tyzzerella sp.]